MSRLRDRLSRRAKVAHLGLVVFKARVESVPKGERWTGKRRESETESIAHL